MTTKPRPRKPRRVMKPLATKQVMRRKPGAYWVRNIDEGAVFVGQVRKGRWVHFSRCVVGIDRIMSCLLMLKDIAEWLEWLPIEEPKWPKARKQ